MSQCAHCKRHHATGEAKELCRQLHNERQSHSTARQELDRAWRMVPGYKISLMKEFPILRRLFNVLVEAVDLQDPLRGAPLEDTMRTQFVHVGVNASTSATEAGVTTHRKPRADVVEIDKRLRQVTDDLSYLISATETEYNPPDGECPECGKLIYQNDTGRKRTYCSTRCRVAASRKVEV